MVIVEEKFNKLLLTERPGYFEEVFRPLYPLHHVPATEAGRLPSRPDVFDGLQRDMGDKLLPNLQRQGL